MSATPVITIATAQPVIVAAAVPVLILVIADMLVGVAMVLVDCAGHNTDVMEAIVVITIYLMVIAIAQQIQFAVAVRVLQVDIAVMVHGLAMEAAD